VLVGRWVGERDQRVGGGCAPADPGRAGVHLHDIGAGLGAREVLVGLGVELPETDGHGVAGNFLDRRVPMSVPYMHGIWQVKPGRADDFVAAWTEFADWTVQHADGTG
jgi:hypothetical protein